MADKRFDAIFNYIFYMRERQGSYPVFSVFRSRYNVGGHYVEMIQGLREGILCVAEYVLRTTVLYELISLDTIAFY